MKKYRYIFTDINSESTFTQIHHAGDIEAAATAQDLADMSNAQLVGCYAVENFAWNRLRPVGLANNIETAKTRAVLVFEGDDLSPNATTPVQAVVKIPAPIGTIIEPGGTLGAAGQTLRDAMLGKLKNRTGVTMSRYVSCRYE